jgi:hypothetical protein
LSRSSVSADFHCPFAFIERIATASPFAVTFAFVVLAFVIIEFLAFLAHSIDHPYLITDLESHFGPFEIHPFLVVTPCHLTYHYRRVVARFNQTY